jgi:hypothetical protein
VQTTGTITGTIDNVAGRLEVIDDVGKDVGIVFNDEQTHGDSG